jgi:hypothetical protein
MSTVQEIERAIQQLSAQELAAEELDPDGI